MNKTLLDREKALSLLSVYEPILTEKQAQFMKSYYVYDLSLSEIAEQVGITRSAVSFTLSSALNKMEEHEERLKILKKQKKLIKSIDKIIENNQNCKAELEKLKEEIENGI